MFPIFTDFIGNCPKLEEKSTFNTVRGFPKTYKLKVIWGRRWYETSDLTSEMLLLFGDLAYRLPGDCILAAGMVSHSGPFTGEYRVGFRSYRGFPSHFFIRNIEVQSRKTKRKRHSSVREVMEGLRDVQRSEEKNIRK